MDVVKEVKQVQAIQRMTENACRWMKGVAIVVNMEFLCSASHRYSAGNHAELFGGTHVGLTFGPEELTFC